MLVKVTTQRGLARAEDRRVRTQRVHEPSARSLVHLRLTLQRRHEFAESVLIIIAHKVVASANGEELPGIPADSRQHAYLAVEDIRDGIVSDRPSRSCVGPHPS